MEFVDCATNFDELLTSYASIQMGLSVAFFYFVGISIATYNSMQIKYTIFTYYDGKKTTSLSVKRSFFVPLEVNNTYISVDG